MDNERRLNIYTRDLKVKMTDGYWRLTPAQRRRAQKKFRRKANKG
jgi:hypothetical protein